MAREQDVHQQGHADIDLMSKQSGLSVGVQGLAKAVSNSMRNKGWASWFNGELGRPIRG